MADQDDHASAAFRELIRYARGLEGRVYQLRVVSGGAELWRVVESPGQQATSIKEADVKSMEETFQLLEEIRRSLTAAGWREKPNCA